MSHHHQPDGHLDGQALDIDEFRVKPGHPIDLAKIDPQLTPQWQGKKKAGVKRAAELNAELEELQEVLWAEHKHRVLIVLQATDSGGKDSTIKHVFEGVNPQGVKVASFKRPSEVELARDYLWRAHLQVPGDGEITIFNRSHYEDVLVVRVDEIVPEDRWRKRYDHIVNWEQMLVDEGTTIIKFFLHITKEEQRERLQDRLDRPSKHWKFEPADLHPRSQWDQYQGAFQDAMNFTSTDDAPWYVIPANRKWYRNIVISEVLVQTLRGLDMSYPPPKPGIATVTIPA